MLVSAVSPALSAGLVRHQSPACVQSLVIAGEGGEWQSGGNI